MHPRSEARQWSKDIAGAVRQSAPGVPSVTDAELDAMWDPVVDTGTPEPASRTRTSSSRMGSDWIRIRPPLTLYSAVPQGCVR